MAQYSVVLPGRNSNVMSCICGHPGRVPGGCGFPWLEVRTSTFVIVVMRSVVDASVVRTIIEQWLDCMGYIGLARLPGD